MPESAAPLAERMAQSVIAVTADQLPATVIDKVKLCLFDLIGGACEARDLPSACAAGTGVNSPGQR